MNIGIIGYGAFGRFLTESWESLPDTKVTYITKTKIETAQAMAEEAGIPYYSADYHDLLASPDVDIAVIATPPHLHEKMAVEALQAGKHVLIEKPLAMDIAEGDNIIRTAKETGRVATVNFMMRHSGLIEKLYILRHEALLGGLTRIIVENYASDEGLSPDHWFWDKTKSGGIFVEHGVHFFDIANWITAASPERTTGLTTERAPGVEDKVLACVRYDNDTLATFYHSFSRPGDLEETTAHYIFHRGEVKVTGWIPMELSLRGVVSDAELSRLSDLFIGADIQTEPLSRGNVVSSGVEYPVSQSINMKYVHSDDKQEEYATCVRGLMSDLIATIEDPQHQMRVTLEDGLRSLQIAQSAAESAQGVY